MGNKTTPRRVSVDFSSDRFAKSEPQMKISKFGGNSMHLQKIHLDESRPTVTSPSDYVPFTLDI